MMDLEERIFRDASAAAAEITPADIPQLQLQLGGRAPRASAPGLIRPCASALVAAIESGRRPLRVTGQHAAGHRGA
jgi:hypothetical protein